MTTSQSYTECALLLRQEIELLEKISVLQAQVKNAIINREWTDFENRFESLAAIGDKFEALDLERAQVFARLAEEVGLDDEEGPFYSCAARLPETERRELSELYRRIKMRTLELRLANESLTKYLSEVQAVVSGFLEAVFPDRKGRIYTRQGIQASPDMLGLALNQSL
jgi:DNA polymerase elongation subunit (family B)